MRLFQNASIQRKQMLVIMLTSLVALLLACAGFIAYEIVSYRTELVWNLTSLAQMIGDTSSGALDFNDPKAAEDILSALRARPNITAACIYTKDGRPFAKYVRGDVAARFSVPKQEAEGHRFTIGRLILFHSIELKGDQIGWIYLESDLGRLTTRFKEYAIIVIVVVFASMLVAYLLSSRLQRWLSEPILQLAKTARAVALEKNYSLRATKQNQDELGMLTDDFNAMLNQIQQQDAAVKSANESLEKRVEERTQQQQATNDQLVAEIAEHQLNKQRLQQAVEDLKAAQEQVIQQERLRALGSMASGIAHDFNNSLFGIVGLTELLLHHPEELDDKAKATRYLEIINTTAKDAGKTVDRLREFYRFREKREALEAVDLNLLVEGAIVLTQPRWKTQAEARGISVTVQRDLHEIPTVTGNVAELREALTNLIFNAVDAMPLGGIITIRTHNKDSQVVLEVSDTGHGMTEEIRRRCFEPFFTTKGTHGTGLGLSMVHGIVQRHQATIEVKSEVGRGSTFIIRFAPQPATAQTASPQQPSAPLRNLHVLLVDDELMVRTIIGEYLAIDGHVVETADNGRDGVKKFGKGQFDLVVVDRAMPDMSGDQVATAIRSIKPSEPIIMLTGFGSMMEANGERPDAVDLVVSKPVTIVNLRAALSKAVAARAA